MVAFDRYKKVYESLVDSFGRQQASLFAVVKMDEDVDTWSVLLSAGWLDDENHKKVLSTLISLLQDELTPEELGSIARIRLADSKDHLIPLFLKDFSEGEHIKEDTQINGNVMHEGFIIALNKPAQTKQASLPLTNR